ncbi:MAG TPA: stage III sporulation protein AF [Candidatus Mediterraneibacter avicola]|nr:stage III sporulation protein AF [Candidatus Mediterraneibacter avicola]
MLEEIYGWIQNISIYLIVTAAVMHAVPGKEYEKYVRFFSGLVLILLLFTPLLRLTGREESFQNIYQSNEYELEKKAIEEAQEWFEDESFLEFLPEEYRNGQGAYDGEEGQEESRRGGIEVEEIKIGE